MQIAANNAQLRFSCAWLFRMLHAFVSIDLNFHSAIRFEQRMAVPSITPTCNPRCNRARVFLRSQFVAVT
jgi:hypothetical protein